MWLSPELHRARRLSALHCWTHCHAAQHTARIRIGGRVETKWSLDLDPWSTSNSDPSSRVESHIIDMFDVCFRIDCIKWSRRNSLSLVCNVVWFSSILIFIICETYCTNSADRYWSLLTAVLHILTLIPDGCLVKASTLVGFRQLPWKISW